MFYFTYDKINFTIIFSVSEQTESGRKMKSVGEPLSIDKKASLSKTEMFSHKAGEGDASGMVSFACK